MLSNLTIKNYAIIDQLELEFSAGLTALTGETGAGKSILLGALGLVLGDRADNESIKQGCDHAEIVAVFDISKLTAVSSWLVEQELNDEAECILRRRITRDGRSRAYINSTPVNLQVIRELGEMLIDIHGQHEHQSMMKPVIQRQLLDDYANHPELNQAVSNAYVQLKLVDEQLQHLEQASNERSDRLDLLRFQTSELEAAELLDDEFQQLNEQHSRLAHAEKLTSTVQQAIHKLHDAEDSTVQSELSRILNTLLDISEYDDKLKPATDLIQDALVQVEEGISELRHYEASLELNPGDLETVEQRLQTIHDLARKHRVEPDQLTTLQQQLQDELNNLDHADERLLELRRQYEELENSYHQSATALSKSRARAAKKLNKAVTQSMQTLGMKGGQFIVELSTLADSRYNAYGDDSIVFTVTANAGQDCKALSRVASGGELARISLAIQMITATQCRIPSLIFDEVDSGVGGGIAEIVGQHLRELGTRYQVLCITHLPQVASQAHQHMRVHKQAERKKTQTQVDTLDRYERVQEVARMLSGVEITQQSLDHAEEMLARAEDR